MVSESDFAKLAITDRLQVLEHVVISVRNYRRPLPVKIALWPGVIWQHFKINRKFGSSVRYSMKYAFLLSLIIFRVPRDE